ncbi:uncharacterized protein [Drosophila suzukii]|uniref:Uncharacterized protein isoform X1 n=1 Tax=Drosophila suzukii TaxID=28584 RepID=A0ABM4TNI6_DROSZ
MKYFIVLLFYGIAWQYSLAAVLPIKPDSPSLSAFEKDENVQLDNHLGPNLSEETITNPHLSDLASLRTNEEPSVKENTEMFDNEDQLKTKSPPLSDFGKVDPIHGPTLPEETKNRIKEIIARLNEKGQPQIWDDYYRPTLSEETKTRINEMFARLNKKNMEVKEVQVSIPQYTKKIELSPRFWVFLVKIIILILLLFSWIGKEHKSTNHSSITA